MFGERFHEAHSLHVFQTPDARLGHEAGGTGFEHVPRYQLGKSLEMSKAATPLPKIKSSRLSEDRESRK